VSWATLAGDPVALTAWVYWPLTGSWFWADDFVNMASIANDGFFRFVLRPFGGHNLLVRNTIFYTWWQLFGLHAAPYFWTVLLTHLLNVWLMFRLLRILTSSATLACLGATLWGASPIAVGTLGWYSVFGQVVVGTMFLVVLRRLAELSRAVRRCPCARPGRGTRCCSSAPSASASASVSRWRSPSPSSSCCRARGASRGCASRTSPCRS
jgi:hypothetical protein